MKIAVIGSRDYEKVSGGIEKHVKMLYESMIDISAEIQIDVFFPKSENSSISPHSFDNLSFVNINSTISINIFEKLIYSFKCLPYIFKKKYNIIHFHGMNSV